MLPSAARQPLGQAGFPVAILLYAGPDAYLRMSLLLNNHRANVSMVCIPSGGPQSGDNNHCDGESMSNHTLVATLATQICLACPGIRDPCVENLGRRRAASAWSLLELDRPSPGLHTLQRCCCWSSKGTSLYVVQPGLCTSSCMWLGHMSLCFSIARLR